MPPVRPPSPRRAAALRPVPSAVRLDVDPAALVKGASAGFTVLLVGELLAPLAGLVSATLGGLWLSLVGAAGYVVAGSRVGLASRTVLQGAGAAVLALLLTLPLRLLAGFAAPFWALGLSAVFAVFVGGLAGRAAAARRDARDNGQS